MRDGSHLTQAGALHIMPNLHIPLLSERPAGNTATSGASGASGVPATRGKG